MQRIGILGYGEIGQAVHKVYLSSGHEYSISVKDVVRDDGLKNLDVLNISIPYNDSFDFVSVVSEVAKSSSAKLVVVHSTVAVGTTRKLKQSLPGVAVVHSPCRGVHPNLLEGLLTFVKFIGSPSIEDAKTAESHLNDLGIRTHVCKNSETSELSKLLDTSYYGVCIAFHGEAAEACRQFDADFEDVMTVYNTTYNAGYTNLNKTNVVRPVLTPPSEGIGGHCVVQNAELLKNQFSSPALEMIIKYKKVRP